MGELIVEYFMQAVNLFIDNIIIVVILALFSLTIMFSNIVAEQEAVGDQMREITEFNQYDNTHCRQQDIISTIYEYRGDPEVTVTVSGGSVLKWSKTSAATAYKTSDISNVIPYNTVYDTQLIYGTNGEVSGITFKACSGGSACIAGG